MNAADMVDKRNTVLGRSHSDDFGSKSELEDGNTKRTAVLRHAPQALTSLFAGTETGQISLVDW